MGSKLLCKGEIMDDFIVIKIPIPHQDEEINLNRMKDWINRSNEFYMELFYRLKIEIETEKIKVFMEGKND